MAKFKPRDWVQIEDIALGVKAIGMIINICSDSNGRGYYQIQWKVVECNKTQGIQPSSLYPLESFDKKGVSATVAEVLYGDA